MPSLLRGVCLVVRLVDKRWQVRRDPSGDWKGCKELLSKITVLLRLDVIGRLHGLRDAEGSAIFRVKALECSFVGLEHLAQNREDFIPIA